MGTETSSSGRFRSGWVVSGLVIVFLIFDGGTKVLCRPLQQGNASPVIGSFQRERWHEYL